MKALYYETREKFSNVYANVIRYGQLKKSLPEKAKNLSGGHDTTQITILTYNFVPFLPVSTQGDNDAIIELRNGKTGTIRINATAETVCKTTHFHTCGQL